MTETEIIEAFRTAMHAAGVRYTGAIDADGELRRVHLDGDRKGTKNGWLVLHLNGKKPAGAFGSHKGDFRATWKADTPAKSLSPAEVKKLQDAARKRAAAQRKAQERAERHARDILAATVPAGLETPYIKRKGIGELAHLFRKAEGRHGGCEFVTPDSLILPVEDECTNIVSVQIIQPDGTKRFLPGGRKAGCMHWLADLPPASIRRIFIAEGAATAASAAMAIGNPNAVLIAFDCGNLLSVGAEVHRCWPDTKIVFLADNDLETDGNPGITKATEAARAVGGLVAVPVFKDRPGAKCDFNDLHLAEGLDRVRELIEAATPPAAELVKIAAKGRPRKNAPNGAFSQPRAKDTPAPPPPAAPDEKPADKKAPLAKFLDPRPDGLFLVTINKDGQETAWKISSPLKLISRGRDQHGEQWGVWIELVNPDGQQRTEFIPWASLHGDASEVMRALAGLGAVITPHPEARRRLVEYLLSETDDRARVVTSTGWHITDAGAAFVLPSTTIGDAGERLFLIGGSAHAAAFGTGGTLEGWQQHVARVAVGNSRLLFALSAAFAPPLLHLLGIENGGINLIGNSATGKTTIVTAAAGVWGKPTALKKTWRSTDNALEGTAAASNDALLVLDELGQCDPRIVGETVYMLGQGAAKARSKTDGTLRRRVEWRTLFLSSAEVSLAEHMREVNRRPRAGQEMRILDVPADAGAERGVFEDLHDHANSGEFRDALDRAVHQHYGHAAKAFLAWLIEHRAEVPEAWGGLRKEFDFEAVPEDAHGQVRRAADRFALVALAGMLAGRAKVAPWSEGSPLDAATRMFKDWLGARGGSGNAELIRALQQVRAWFAAHAEARLADFDRTAADDDHAPRVIQRAGFRRHDKTTAKSTFYVFPSVFNDEICKGYNPTEVSRELLRLKHLVPQKDKGREVPYSKQRLPGYSSPVRVYVFEDSIFNAGQDDDPGSEADE